MQPTMNIRTHCNIKYIFNLCKDLHYHKKNHRIIFVFTYSNITLFAKNGLKAQVMLYLNYYQLYYFINQMNPPPKSISLIKK